MERIPLHRRISNRSRIATFFRQLPIQLKHSQQCPANVRLSWFSQTRINSPQKTVVAANTIIKLVSNSKKRRDLFHVGKPSLATVIAALPRPATITSARRTTRLCLTTGVISNRGMRHTRSSFSSNLRSGGPLGRRSKSWQTPAKYWHLSAKLWSRLAWRTLSMKESRPREKRWRVSGSSGRRGSERSKQIWQIWWSLRTRTCNSYKLLTIRWTKPRRSVTTSDRGKVKPSCKNTSKSWVAAPRIKSLLVWMRESSLLSREAWLWATATPAKETPQIISTARQ